MFNYVNSNNLYVKQIWAKTKKAILETANEEGKRKINKNNIPIRTLWFGDNINAFLKNKKHNIPAVSIPDI